METRLYYMVEDDYDISSLYVTKEPWLESLRYNLDTSVEYEDLSQEESDEVYQKAEENTINELLEVNGFYYSVQEIKIAYQNNNLIVRYNDADNSVMFYTLDAEEKRYDVQEEDTIYSADEVRDKLQKFITDKYFDIDKLDKDIKKLMEK